MPPKITQEMLEKRAAAVRLGGKGSVRRGCKVQHKASGEDKKVTGVLKKLGVTPVNDIDEATMIKMDGTAMFFTKPKVQASMQNQCFVVSGNYDTKDAAELLPKEMADLLKKVTAAQAAVASEGAATA